MAEKLAKVLQLSEAAVSMALNNKVGVGTATRQRVLKIAREQGYDFSRVQEPKEPQIERGTMSSVILKKHGAVVTNIPFFNQLTEGIDLACRQAHYSLNTSYLYADDSLSRQLSSLSYYNGMTLLATKTTTEDFGPFEKLGIFLVVLDTYFQDLEFDYVLINSFQGAYQTTDFLIYKTESQSGYSRSSYPIDNSQERTDGLYRTVRENGLSPSRSQIFSPSLSMEGVCEDMLELLKPGKGFFHCYFADNSSIAAGAMKAVKKMGCVIPRDVSIIGFDNMPLYTYIESAPSTVHAPKQYVGQMAASRLIQIIEPPDRCPVKIEAGTKITDRESV